MQTYPGPTQPERSHVEGTPARHWPSLVLFILVVMLAAGLGGFFTRSGVAEWYPSLSKPAWTPPGWVFGPVWTSLYASMALAAWLVWLRRDRKPVFGAMVAFSCQLILNAVWPALFFGLRSPVAAFVEIALLWGVIVATVALFWRIRPVAAVLLIPYGLWVTFAAGLNFAIMRLNS